MLKPIDTSLPALSTDVPMVCRDILASSSRSSTVISTCCCKKKPVKSVLVCTCHRWFLSSPLRPQSVIKLSGSRPRRLDQDRCTSASSAACSLTTGATM
jgi:hypothetical protein